MVWSSANITDEKLLVRIANIYARNNDYDKAAEWLIMVGTYKDTAGIFAYNIQF